MCTQILKRLKAIEKEKRVRILYACEAGSRAWGFPSKDSDYDVRFIYVHDESWYLDIDRQKRDVIEYMEDPLDFVGWELSKALRLFKKSNPPLLEWLYSPVVYINKLYPGGHNISSDLKEQLPIFYSPISCMYHYFNMGKGNYREYLNGDKVWVKKYFYVLRPIIACRWIEKNLTNAVPVDFEILMNSVELPPGILASVKNLIEDKRNGKELDMGPKIENIHAFIDNEMDRLELVDFKGMNLQKLNPQTQTDKLNGIFRKFVRSATVDIFHEDMNDHLNGDY